MSASAYGIDMLFTGQKWYPDLSLYDLRARLLPNLGRFLQPDPIGFAGDPSNIYRYCGNNPVNRSDPSGEGFEYTQNGNNIHFYIPVNYIGNFGATQILSLNNGIEQAWTGSFGQYNVTTTVIGPVEGLTNNVALTLGTGRSNSANIYLPGDRNDPARFRSRSRTLA